MANTQDIVKLANIINRADQIYHGQGSSIMADQEYDQLKAQLRVLDPSNPILNRVGAPVPADSALAKTKHTFLMGSLKDAMTMEAFKDWLNGLPAQTPQLFASPKLDGFSLALYYQDGLLVRAVTRGDGSEGEDITHNAVRFDGVPTVLPVNFTGAIRGEVVLHVDAWQKLDPDQESNPRNLAAGMGRRKDGENAESLAFYPFDLIAGAANPATATNEHEARMLTMVGWGFKNAGWYCGDSKRVVNYQREVAAQRSSLPFWIDGVVVRVNGLALFDDLGVSDKRPRGAIAWKFPAEKATTTLKGVKVTVGHTGKIVPTADLKPVRIGGTTVSSAHLCNWVQIGRLGIAIGDQVEVIKAGDVIPQIVGLAKQAEGRKVIAEPASCPVCGGKVGRQKNVDSESVDLYCLNNDCPAKAQGKIRRWIKSLDIQGIGDEVLDALIRDRHVSTISDLYEPDQLNLQELQVNGRALGKSRAARILAEIDKTRRLTIDQFLGSLGIKHLGKRKVALIRQAAGDGALDDLSMWVTHHGQSMLIAGADKLSIPNIAAEIQADIDAKRPLIEGLLRFITIAQPAAPAQVTNSHPLTGKLACFTGVRPDDTLKARMAALGISEASGVSKKTHVLVLKDKESNSSKAVKARELGLQLMDLEEFKEAVA